VNQFTTPHKGLARVSRIISGDPSRGIEPLVPVSRATWYQMVKDGRAPKPIRLSEGVSVWRIADIEEMLAKIEQQAAEVSQ